MPFATGLELWQWKISIIVFVVWSYNNQFTKIVDFEKCIKMCFNIENVEMISTYEKTHVDDTYFISNVSVSAFKNRNS